MKCSFFSCDVSGCNVFHWGGFIARAMAYNVLRASDKTGRRIIRHRCLVAIPHSALNTEQWTMSSMCEHWAVSTQTNAHCTTQLRLLSNCNKSFRIVSASDLPMKIRFWWISSNWVCVSPKNELWIKWVCWYRENCGSMLFFLLLVRFAFVWCLIQKLRQAKIAIIYLVVVSFLRLRSRSGQRWPKVVKRVSHRFAIWFICDGGRCWHKHNFCSPKKLKRYHNTNYLVSWATGYRIYGASK